jgi:hypothetical protein
MVTFEIQEISKVRGNGCKCEICCNIIDSKTGTHRVKSGGIMFHMGCYYKHILRYADKNGKRSVTLKGHLDQLKKHMPEILAETIVNGNQT